MPSLYMNNTEVSFQQGQSLLEVAGANQIPIPTLCYLAGTRPTGQCRICVVEAEGSEVLLPACDTKAAAGMKILTNSPRVRAARKMIIEMMLASGAHNCFAADMAGPDWTENQLKIMEKPWHQVLCPSHGDCRLQDLAIEYGASIQGMEMAVDGHPLDDTAPVIIRDFSRCIGCGRCVQACNDVQVNHAIQPPFGRREDHPDGWYPIVNYDNCTHCGECVQACPVGALFERKAFGLAKANETEKVRTTCPYCGVGCQQILHVKDGKIVRVTGAEDGSPNKGRLCVKGRYGYDFIYSPDRLKTPLIREGEKFREASWDEALDLVVTKFKQIIAESGPDALAGVSCARSINEDSYAMQKFFRAVVKTNNIDHCART
jgi:predicted molibdopterin-dependent oxidoreductase YjgC